MSRRLASPENSLREVRRYERKRPFRDGGVQVAALQKRREETLRQILGFLGTVAISPNEIHREATNKYGEAFRALHLRLVTNLARLVPALQWVVTNATPLVFTLCSESPRSWRGPFIYTAKSLPEQ